MCLARFFVKPKEGINSFRFGRRRCSVSAPLSADEKHKAMAVPFFKNIVNYFIVICFVYIFIYSMQIKGWFSVLAGIAAENGSCQISSDWALFVSGILHFLLFRHFPAKNTRAGRPYLRFPTGRRNGWRLCKGSHAALGFQLRNNSSIECRFITIVKKIILFPFDK